MNADVRNAAFEAVGCVLLWGNVRSLLRDKHVAGVSLWVTAFYVAWNLSALFYYAELGHWYSWAGALGTMVAHATWLALALRYRRK